MEDKKCATSDCEQYRAMLKNSCCVPGGYKGFNLYTSNPFDSREIRQPNPWCSNELILRDKAMRCAARIQPIDTTMEESLKLAKADAVAKGIWNR
jgi:hypothetical protein